MESEIVKEIFLVLLAGFAGGYLAKLVKFQPIIGYIVSGIILGSFFSLDKARVSSLASLGVILLLFSNGIELSLERLTRNAKIAIVGAVGQIVITSAFIYPIFMYTGFSSSASILLSFGFSLSSTALVIKMLGDRGEIDTIHAELMIGWLLVQDLAVIPIMVISTAILGSGGFYIAGILTSLAKAFAVIVAVYLLGKRVIPFLMDRIAQVNSRELLTIGSLVFAVGVAIVSSFLGVPAALGAFLGGIVISHTHQNHAIFAETRPLRDIFVAMFFISLGFWARPEYIFPNIIPIILISMSVILLKTLIYFFVGLGFGYRGKTIVMSGMGMANVGEFSFLLIAQAISMSLVDDKSAAIAVSSVLLTLVLSPFLFKAAIPFWRYLKAKSANVSFLRKVLSGYGKVGDNYSDEITNHTVICGYGRMGMWISKFHQALDLPYIVLDYNHNVVEKARKSGVNIVFGDPSESGVLESVNVDSAKAVVIAIPDRVAREEIITSVQTRSRSIKIFARAQTHEEIERLKFLRVDFMVQPEFEAALATARSIMKNMGKDTTQINKRLGSLRKSFMIG